MILGDLYDADRRTRDPETARLAAGVLIPHPLHEVQYGDGFIPDNTAGRIRSFGRRVPR